VDTWQVTTSFCTDCVNYRGQTALELAAGVDNLPMVEMLVHLGATRRAIDCAVTRASLAGSVGVVSLLLDAKPVAEGPQRQLYSDHKHTLCPNKNVHLLAAWRSG